MPDSNPLQPGQKFGNGRFVLVRFLGRGGMGEVWLAQDERLDEPVALKFLPSEVRADPVALDDLRRETARSHKLTHPNIVRIHDLHEDADGTAFIVMEYVGGPTLAAVRLEQPGRVVAWDYLRPLVQQLCAALDYAHGENVIHRDLKPANIMVDARGRLKLADFGIAAVMSDSMSRVSVRHSTSGTLLYMSPQQLSGKRPQATDDIYGLGATLYELLTSKPPFYTGDLTHQVLHEPPEPLEERMAAMGIQNPIPPDMTALLMACLAKEPAQRPQSALVVAEWIGLAVVPKPSAVSPAEEPLSEQPIAEAMPAAPASSKKFLWAGASLVALLLLAVGGWHWVNHHRDKQAPLSQEQPGASETKIPAAAALEDGFVSLFNGRDFTGWGGDKKCWSVNNGVLDLLSDASHGNPAWRELSWTNGGAYDFELHLRYRFVAPFEPYEGRVQQYFRMRTSEDPSLGSRDWSYFTEFEPNGGSYGAIFTAQRGNSYPMLARSSQRRIIRAGAPRQAAPIGEWVGSPSAISDSFNQEDWNDVVIRADGPRITVTINTMMTAELLDEDSDSSPGTGISLAALRDKGFLHAQFKDIRLKRLTLSGTQPAAAEVPGVTQPSTQLTRGMIRNKRFRFTWKSGKNAGYNGMATLRNDGTIAGIGSPNETFWLIDGDGQLTFKHRDGRISTTFTHAERRNGQWFLSGPFQFIHGVQHFLEEASDADASGSK